MRDLAVVVPGRLATRTGGYEYDRRMIAGLRALGRRVEVRELDGPFPNATSSALARAADVLAAIPDDTTVLFDGLAAGVLPAQLEAEASRLRIVVLVHMPLGADSRLDRESAAALSRGERRALSAAAGVVVTGSAVLSTIAEYGIASNCVAVVEPGTEPAPLAHGSGGALPLQLLCAATINAGKDHALLIEALAAVPHRDWHLTCAGSLDRDPRTVERVRAMLLRDGVASRVSLVGELDAAALATRYDRADLFVLASRHETYCMAVAEALGRGLPVVATRTGAIPELVGDAAGIVVPPGDRPALTSALARVLGDACLRDQLAAGARQVRQRLPSWDDASRKMAMALDRFSTVADK
jgi:glycosyltransferase involved in cell wall biosynthesis